MNRSPAETRARVEKSLRRRYWAERRFRAYGLGAVMLGLLFVVFLFGTIISNGLPAFRQAEVTLAVNFDAATIDPDGKRDAETLAAADYAAVVRASLRAKFPDAEGRVGGRKVMGLVSNSAASELQKRVVGESEAHRHHREGHRPGQRRRGPAAEGQDRPQVAGRRAPAGRSAGALDRDAREGRQPRAALQHAVLHQRRFARARAGRRARRAGGLGLDAAGDAAAVVPDRRRRRGLPRGVRAPQPLDRPHRGQHQQPRRRAVDRVRPAGSRRVPEFRRHAALGAAGRRPGADAADAADDHHRRRAPH